MPRVIAARFQELQDVGAVWAPRRCVRWPSRRIGILSNGTAAQCFELGALDVEAQEVDEGRRVGARQHLGRASLSSARPPDSSRPLPSTGRACRRCRPGPACGVELHDLPGDARDHDLFHLAACGLPCALETDRRRCRSSLSSSSALVFDPIVPWPDPTSRKKPLVTPGNIFPSTHLSWPISDG